MRFSHAALGAAWLLSGSVTAHPADIYSVFTNPSNNWDAHTTIEFPNSTAFENATERWNTFDEPTFSIAITPGTDADVAKAVKLARSNNFPFLGTGGRHSSSVTLGALQNGVAIDLSGLNSVSVDSAAATVTVGGGVRFGAVVDPVYEAGFEVPIGSYAYPGMVGATIGGGVGRWQGLHGLIIDNLLSVRMVTADGNLITVSNTSYPDLWWAVRGAAANFGLITSATYLRPLINGGQLMNAHFILPASANASYFDYLASLQGTMPAELATITFIMWNDTIGESQILINWVWIGPEEEGQKYIAPLYNLNPTEVSVEMVAWNKITNTAAFGLGVPICEPVHIKGYGANFRNLSSTTYQDVFRDMSDFYAAYPDGRGSSVEIEIFAPQAVAQVADDATAYPWRDSLGISFGWNSTATEQAGDAMAMQVRAAFAATGGYSGLATYVSYAHGDETLEQMWGGNVPRLQQLKEKYDPDNVFRFFHDLAQ
ncbi:hypothetical protein QBC46DRAFT_461661 [Diplogelasinospora grovesii]|uniref:FAD-binding PCMH-type domain-containing protein n=1 Tax=Diplogelasinospora grovesii TaxID=303347 RepID=A0AAN6S1A7_9PEZI|nr:hypothetical protein QBC46DRAFT_461661 [Diplogelasinospora grovesii]